MWSRPLLPYHWTPSSSTAQSTTPAPPAAVAEARDVGSARRCQTTNDDGPPGNDDEPAIELKRKEAPTDDEHEVLQHADRLQQQQLYQQRRLASAAAALRQRQDHQHAQMRAFGHADLLPPPHHHAQPVYQLPSSSYHAVGAYHLPLAVGHAHPPPPQFHAVGLLPPPYHAQPLHHAPVVDRGSHASPIHTADFGGPPRDGQLHLHEAFETEEEMARRNARIYALGAYQDEEKRQRREEEREEARQLTEKLKWERENCPVLQRRKAMAKARLEQTIKENRGKVEARQRKVTEAAEKEERQREAAEKEEEMARRRSGRDARMKAWRAYEAELQKEESPGAKALRKGPGRIDPDWGEKFMRYLSSQEAKCEEMRSRLDAARDSLGDPEATKKAKTTLGKRDKIISGISRGEKRATRSLGEAGEFVSFCLKFSGYYNCECCCKARAAEVMDQAVEKLKQEEDEEDFFGLTSNLFSSDH